MWLTDDAPFRRQQSHHTLPVAIELSNALAEEARTAAEDANRSLTGQVEHWARIGKAVEPHLSNQTIAFLKRNGRRLPVEEERVAIQKTLKAFESILTNPPYEKTRELIFGNGAVYEADPADPTGIVQVHQDGPRIAGKMIDRHFVANQAD